MNDLDDFAQVLAFKIVDHVAQLTFLFKAHLWRIGNYRLRFYL